MVQTLNLKLFGRLSNKVIIIITGMRVAPRIEVSGSESKRPGLKIVSASCKLVQRLRVFKEHLAEDSAVAWDMRSGSSAHRFTVAPVRSVIPSKSIKWSRANYSHCRRWCRYAAFLSWVSLRAKYLLGDAL